MKNLSIINHQSSIIVGIDANEANVRKRVGSNVYAHQLLKEFYALKNQNLQFRIYLKDKPLADFPYETDFWHYKVLPAGFLWTQWRLPLALITEKEKADVFFSPGHYAPSFCPIPLVISILDVSYLRFPSQFRPQDLWKLRLLTKRSVYQAKKILAISKASKDDIIEYYQAKPEKIKVTYLGVNKSRKMENKNIKDKIQNLKKKYKIKGDYLIYVGTLQPRKNLVRLIEAFNKLKATTQNLKLLIVGKKGWLYDKIFAKVKALQLEDDVIFTGFVADEELPYLVKGSICLVLVSLYEGFGFPVLEAMSLGVPVITSNVSSLPEVAGKAAILVDPYKTKEITKAIEKMVHLYREEEDKYQEFIKKGKEQAKKFSWQKCAQETLEVLKEVVIKNSNP